MRTHDWPGNVRELEYVLERIALVDDHDLTRKRRRAFVPAGRFARGIPRALRIRASFSMALAAATGHARGNAS
jgi:transcriptional regulator with GAF, ATPase, and Fis domain